MGPTVRPQQEAKAEQPEATGGQGAPWPRLKWSQRLPLLIAVVVMAAVTVPRLPPGICYGDPGDLQLAAATLGIAHPPGYTGYVTFGYLLTRLPGVDPAYVVSLACLAAGIGAILLCALMQVRLGLSAWMAAAIAVALTAVPRVWQNLLVPEVYGPSLALLAGSTYLSFKYARLGLRRDLLLAALLFGVAAANRPPVASALPFFAIAWWLASRKGTPSRGQAARSALLATACLVLPGAYALGFLWLRDTPTAGYNYIEQYNTEMRELPAVEAGPRAKLQRIVWQATGRQFRSYVGNDWRKVRGQLRWLREELDPGGAAASWIALAIVVLGAVIAARRCGASVWLLGGMMVQTVIFVCAYRIRGQAADLLPLIWAAVVAAGVGLSVLFPASAHGVRRIAAVGLLIVTCTWTAVDADNRPNEARNADATPYLAAVDLGSFPDAAVICSSWGQSPPLWYAQKVLTDRDDIRIINAEARNWLTMIGEVGDRRVFVTDSRVRLPEQYRLRPYRKLWQLEQGIAD